MKQPSASAASQPTCRTERIAPLAASEVAIRGADDLPLPASQERLAGSDRTKSWFWGAVIAHGLAWTLVPAFTQPNAPLDVLEITYWGHAWQWGYAKHPPLPSWLAEGVYSLTGQNVTSIYLLAQACMLACFWSVWQVGRQMTSPVLAVAAVVVLEGCAFFTYNSPEFNHAICLNAFCGLTVLHFYRAVRKPATGSWLLAGLFAGLGMLSKYNMATLLTSLLAFSLYEPSSRGLWRTRGPYLAIATMLLVLAPHVWWMWSHGFHGAAYLAERTKSTGTWLARWANPIEFAGGQLLIVLPVVLVGLAALARPWRRTQLATAGQRFDLRFVSFVVFGPFFQALLISFVGKMHLRSAYGMSLWMFLGLWLLLKFETVAARIAWPRVATLSAVAGLAMLAAAVLHNLAGPGLRHKGSRIHFPGADLAAAVEQVWREQYQSPLPIAAGEWWLAANVNFYGHDRASVYGGSCYVERLELTPNLSSWNSDDTLNRRGGVILWNTAYNGHELPQHLAARFPRHSSPQVIQLPWKTAAALSDLQIAVVIVPPAEVVARPTTRVR